MSVTSHIEKVKRLADSLKELGAIRSDTVYNAFSAVPRHLFFTRYYSGIADEEFKTADPENPREEELEFFYANSAVVTKKFEGIIVSSSTQPSLMAAMLEHLELAPGMRVLEVGTGSGYNAALISQIVGESGRVVSVEIDADIADRARGSLERFGGVRGNIRVLAGDAVSGCAEDAPFDRIIVTAACPDVAPAWISQMAKGGILLIPFRSGGLDPLVKFKKEREGVLNGRALGWCGFMNIRGKLSDTGHHGRRFADFPAAESKPGGGVSLSTFDGDISALFDFAFFAVLCDGRATLYRPFLASDPPDISPGLAIEAVGDYCRLSGSGIEARCESPLPKRMAELFGEWEGFRRPAISQYEFLVFSGIAGGRSLHTHRLPDGVRAWLVERNKCINVVSLKP